MHIALIDDDNTTNFIHEKKLFKKYPLAQVTTFINGREAIESIKNNMKFDLALLDLNMPVLDGLGFLKEHNEIKEDQKITKIVLFSNQKVSPELIKKYNINLVTEKPLNINLL